MNNKLSWKIRSNIIAPWIKIIQSLMWNNIQKIIKNSTNKDIDELLEISSNKSMAIVWNSPNLINKSFGREIDSHDYVLRFNRWVDSSHLNANETWIKTTHWSTWTLDTLTYYDLQQDILDRVKFIIPFAFQNSKYKNVWLNTLLLNTKKWYKNTDKYYVDNLFYDSLYQELWSEPSSGFVFINYFLLKTAIEKISLYWFDFSTDNRITWNTYAKQHDFEKENAKIDALIQQYDKKILMK
mgnify:CR=1 FL=1